MNKLKLVLLLSSFWILGHSQSEITKDEIKEHISFLTSNKNAGRYPGGANNKRVVRYLKKQFKSIGLTSSNKYLQPFNAKLRVEKEKKPVVKTWNIVGIIEGSDSVFKHEYIVLGAHYDHLGLGGILSKSENKNSIHFGADDNASGVAALLEIAEKLVVNKQLFKRSIIIVAFGAEEQGLLGSKYFVNNPPVPLKQIKLMINMDMVGRLNKEKHVYMGGAGTFPGGVELMKNLGKSLGLNPIVHAGSVGGSDHVSFYKKNISVLGIHTGGHPQYHTPEDTIDLINFEGEKKVCQYIYQAIFKVASTSTKMSFIKQD